MDIYILREGNEIGPFSEVTTQTLLTQGTISPTDLAWRPGMAQWIPLDDILAPGSAESAPDAVPQNAPENASPPPAPAVLATERQKAFLRFMEIPFTEELTRDRAAVMLNDTMEDPKDAARVARWNVERLELHPDLFDAEIQALKESRPNRFLQIAQNEGAEFFTKVTKAHCLVVVGHLDLRFPDWDAKPKEATWNYFFPAIAEKFPQLVNKSAIGKFKYPDTGKAPAKASASKAPANKAPAVRAPGEGPRRPAPVAAPKAPNPVAAAFRGLLIGAILLGALIGVNEYRKRQIAMQTVPGAEAKAPAESLKSEELSPSPAPAVANSVPPAVPSAPVIAAAPEAGAMAAVPEAAAAPVELAPAPAEPVPTPPKTSVTITQPVKVATPFGVVVIRPGTQAKIVSREGANISVRYLNNTVAVPIASTDLGDAAIAEPAAPVASPVAPPATPPPPVAPVKPPTSLF